MEPWYHESVTRVLINRSDYTARSPHIARAMIEGSEVYWKGPLYHEGSEIYWKEPLYHEGTESRQGCNTLQHTATLCNILQHTGGGEDKSPISRAWLSANKPVITGPFAGRHVHDKGDCLLGHPLWPLRIQRSCRVSKMHRIP